MAPSPHLPRPLRDEPTHRQRRLNILCLHALIGQLESLCLTLLLVVIITITLRVQCHPRHEMLGQLTWRFLHRDLACRLFHIPQIFLHCHLPRYLKDVYRILWLWEYGVTRTVVQHYRLLKGNSSICPQISIRALLTICLCILTSRTGISKGHLQRYI